VARTRRDQPSNDQLRTARERLNSPTGSMRPSRQELAEAIKPYLWRVALGATEFDGKVLYRLEGEALQQAQSSCTRVIPVRLERGNATSTGTGTASEPIGQGAR
jgi:hypothetical protein